MAAAFSHTSPCWRGLERHHAAALRAGVTPRTPAVHYSLGGGKAPGASPHFMGALPFLATWLSSTTDSATYNFILTWCGVCLMDGRTEAFGRAAVAHTARAFPLHACARHGPR